MNIVNRLRVAALGALLAAGLTPLAPLAKALAQGAYSGSGPQPVSRGATGRAALTQNNLLFGNGTDPVGFLSPASVPGRCVVSDGTSWLARYCLVTGSIVGTAPVTVNIVNGAATVALTIDSNFAVVSNMLALAAIPSGNLIANAAPGTAEPTATTLTAYLDRAIGAINGQFPARVGGAWTAATLGTGLGFSGSAVTLQPAGAAAIGGVNSVALSPNNWVQWIGTDGVPRLAQPGFANLSGSATCAQLPALTGSITTTAGTCGPTTIAAGAVTYAMMQNVAAARLLGNPGASPAAPSEVSLGATLSFVGTALQTGAGTGDVAWSANGFNTAIQPAAVSFAKFQNLAALSVFGNCTNAAATGANVTGAANQVLRVNGAGTSCGFGAIDLSQAAAATGVLQAASAPGFTGGDVTSTAGSLVLSIGANKVTNAQRAQMAAWTLKGNVSGATANETDFTIGGLTNKSTPAGADLVMIQDQAAGGAYKYATLTQVIGAVASGVSSFVGRTGAVVATAGDYAFSQISGLLNLATQVTGILPVANGGAPQGAWTAYTPTLSCAGGSLTSGSAAGWYQTSAKTTRYRIIITVTAVGSCAVAFFTATPNNAQGATCFSAANNITNVGSMACVGAGGSSVVSTRYDNGGNLNVTSGQTLVISGEYESQ